MSFASRAKGSARRLTSRFGEPVTISRPLTLSAGGRVPATLQAASVAVAGAQVVELHAPSLNILTGSVWSGAVVTVDTAPHLTQEDATAKDGVLALKLASPLAAELGIGAEVEISPAAEVAAQALIKNHEVSGDSAHLYGDAQWRVQVPCGLLPWKPPQGALVSVPSRGITGSVVGSQRMSGFDVLYVRG